MRRIHRVLIASALSISSIGAASIPEAHAAGAHASGATAPAATYVVKAGDNLVGIAKKLKVRFADLLAANSFTATSVIHPGDTLVVPAGTAPATASLPATPSQAATPAAAPQRTYVVLPGDALIGIAMKHGVKLGPLLKANKFKIDSVVHPGDTLIIPAGGTLVVSPDPASSGPAIATNSAAPTAATPAAATPAAATTEATSSAIDTVIAYATAQLGKPWKFNTAGPDSFDCSGLSSAAYAEIGLYLPHQSAMQATRGIAVDWRTEPIQAGDLVFMFTTSHPDVISHVGIAIDSKRWIHAPRSGDVVRVGMLPSADKIQAVRRYVNP
jgi:cell wall-associated NlpC family hydrolase